MRWLPIALTVTGSDVAFLSSAQGDFSTACHAYATRLAKETINLGDKITTEGTKSLNASITLSLEFLHDNSRGET